ncbi:hypothetical protein ACOMHN_060441 [Nucella lapillus]
MAQRSSACLIVMAVGCFAAILRPIVPCSQLTWEGQHGPISCCPLDYTMTVVNAQCACHPALALAPSPSPPATGMLRLLTDTTARRRCCWTSRECGRAPNSWRNGSI